MPAVPDGNCKLIYASRILYGPSSLAGLPHAWKTTHLHHRLPSLFLQERPDCESYSPDRELSLERRIKS